MSTPNTHYGKDKIEQMLTGIDNLFFIGIGGISMSSLARLSAHRGFRVGGSDHADSAMKCQMSDESIEIFIGHDSSHLDHYDAVAYTVVAMPSTPKKKSGSSFETAG